MTDNGLKLKVNKKAYKEIWTQTPKEKVVVKDIVNNLKQGGSEKVDKIRLPPDDQVYDLVKEWIENWDTKPRSPSENFNDTYTLLFKPE